MQQPRIELFARSYDLPPRNLPHLAVIGPVRRDWVEEGIFRSISLTVLTNDFAVTQ